MFGNQRIDTYTQIFSAVPGAFAGREGLNEGGQILLPQSVLQDISTLNLVFPLQFELKSFRGKSTHCGVLEFLADEGHAALPQWMMQQLRLEPGEMVTIRTVALPKAEFVKIKPLQTAFIELHDPRAVLESRLSNFKALTVGDVIDIHYCGTVYQLELTHVRARGGSEVRAASIIDTEVQVDFERPADMPDSPVRSAPPAAGPTGANVIGSGAGAAAAASINFTPVKTYKPPSLADDKNKAPSSAASGSRAAFAGSGRSLSGKPAVAPTAAAGGKAQQGSAAASGGRTLSGSLSGGRTLSGNPAPAPSPAVDGNDGAATAAPAAGRTLAGGRTLRGDPAPAVEPAQANPPQPQPGDAAFKPFAGSGRTLK